MQVAGPLRNTHNAIVGVLVSTETDITERKNSEVTIEQERLRLAGIINAAMDGIITIDESRHRSVQCRRREYLPPSRR